MSRLKHNAVNLKVTQEALADLGGGVRDARPPPGRPNSFDFMQFSGKFGVFTPPPRENPGSATEKVI